MPLYKALKLTSKRNIKFSFIYLEPSIEAHQDTHPRHLSWILKSIEELKQQIPINFYHDEAQTFLKFSKKYEITQILAHQESGTTLHFPEIILSQKIL